MAMPKRDMEQMIMAMGMSIPPTLVEGAVRVTVHVVKIFSLIVTARVIVTNTTFFLTTVLSVKV